MTSYDIYVLKNHLAVKIGILEKKENKTDSDIEIINAYKHYEKYGTTIIELKLLFEDVKLALEEEGT